MDQEVGKLPSLGRGTAGSRSKEGRAGWRRGAGAAGWDGRGGRRAYESRGPAGGQQWPLKLQAGEGRGQVPF